MSISFTAMQNALLANGIYEITEDTRLYAELKAYDAGLQMLHDQLDELLQEALIPTAVSYGLEEKELLFGLNLSSCTEEERRKLLCMRGAINVNSFNRVAKHTANRRTGFIRKRQQNAARDAKGCF